jgi:hypothetical protein
MPKGPEGYSYYSSTTLRVHISGKQPAGWGFMLWWTTKYKLISQTTRYMGSLLITDMKCYRNCHFSPQFQGGVESSPSTYVKQGPRD